jgi:large subunit ribosomal protein L17
VQSLILSEKIQTTEAKAKAIKPLVDKLITQAKSKTASRHVFEFFSQKTTAQKLVDDVAPRTGGRTSGYTSMVKIGPRLGDGAMIVSMSLLLEERKASSVKGKQSLRSSDLKEAKQETTEMKAEVKAAPKAKVAAPKSKTTKEKKA